MTGRVCVFKVKPLRVEREIAIGDALLMPVPPPDNEIWGTDFQREWLERWFSDNHEIASLVRVPYDPTLGEPDADIQARKLAEAALARYRLAVDAEGNFHPNQLQFTLDDVRWIPGGTMGWSLGGGVPIGLEIVESDPASKVISESRFLSVPTTPAGDIERRVARAITWLDRAYLESDELIQLLHRFSALEALLGDASDGLKGHELAIRRATLASMVEGVFRHPKKTFDLYKEVRSYATHGEEVRELEPDEGTKFAWDAREAVDQYIRYADQHGFSRRSKLVAALDGSETRAEIVARLVQEDGEKWAPYAPSPMTFGAVIMTLLGMLGSEVVVSYSSSDAVNFSRFSGVLESGIDAAHAEVLDRDQESVELQFNNGVVLTLDPKQFKHAEQTAPGDGAILTVRIGRAKISFIAADLS